MGCSPIPLQCSGVPGLVLILFLVLFDSGVHSAQLQFLRGIAIFAVSLTGGFNVSANDIRRVNVDHHNLFNTN